MLSMREIMIGFEMLQQKEEAVRDRTRRGKTKVTNEKGRTQPRPPKVK